MMPARTTRSMTQEPTCLFCFNACYEPTPQFPEPIVGAVRCSELEKQLQHVFILRQLLDIPSSWCEEALQRLEGNCGPESWFQLCSSCIYTVHEAWRLQQKILRLESRLSSIKTEIKEVMLEGVLKTKKRRKLQEGIDNEIRGVVFPDLILEGGQQLSTKNSEYVDIDQLSDYSNRNADSSEDVQHNDIDTDNPRPLLSRRKGRLNKRRRYGKMKRPKKQSKLKGIGGPLYSMHICKQCPAKFKDDAEFEAHQYAHELSLQNGGVHTCEHCSFPARDEEDLKIHMNYKHINKKEYIRAHYCPKCDFKSSTWINLKTHALEEHPDIPQEEFGNDLELKCNVCLKYFDTFGTLKVHKTKMHPELLEGEKETVACDQCSQRFPSRILLRFHVNNTHMRITKFVCDICGKGFKTSIALDRHKVTHQTGKREFVCHLCGCDYSHKSVLIEHYKKCHPGDQNMTENDAGQKRSEEEFKCKYCEMTSQYKVVIMRHLQTHKEEMGHKCDICFKYYTNTQGLKRHKRINHSATNQDVNCPHCFKSFPNIDYMRTHVSRYCKLKSQDSAGPGHDQLQIVAVSGCKSVVDPITDPGQSHDSYGLTIQTNNMIPVEAQSQSNLKREPTHSALTADNAPLPVQSFLRSSEEQIRQVKHEFEGGVQFCTK